MTAGCVELRVEWSVLPPQANAVGTALHAVLADTRREPGCLNCSLATDMGEYITLRIVEAWDSEDSLRRHVRSARFEALAGVMESAFAPPRVEFVLPTGTRGLEYAQDVRRSPGAAR
jgi:quinol monooxygenase YgiN